MNRLNDVGIVIIATIIIACAFGGFIIRKWQPTTESGKIEQEVIEEVLDAVETSEEKALVKELP